MHRRKYIYVYPSRRYAQRCYCIRYILPRNNKYKGDKIYPKYLMPKRDDMYPRDGSYPRGDGVIHTAYFNAKQCIYYQINSKANKK